MVCYPSGLLNQLSDTIMVFKPLNFIKGICDIVILCNAGNVLEGMNFDIAVGLSVS